MKDKYIIGIDEVGRGPLAGPVTVGVVLLKNNFNFPKKLPKLRDSKKMSERNRELWFDFVLNNSEIFYETSSVYPSVIDRIGISKSVYLAGMRGLKRLINKNNLKNVNYKILTDGLIKVGEGFKYKSIIKGDEKINAIKLASIMAKVTRDRKMVKYHLKNSLYSFDKHKGYGTKVHMDLIKKYGPSKIHRLTFLKS
jgi:ribonuclease HII